jgi:hypothetical protein
MRRGLQGTRSQGTRSRARASGAGHQGLGSGAHAPGGAGHQGTRSRARARRAQGTKGLRSGAHAPGVQGARGRAHIRVRAGRRAPRCSSWRAPAARWTAGPSSGRLPGPRPRRCGPARGPCCELRGADARACTRAGGAARTGGGRVQQECCAVPAALATCLAWIRPCLLGSLSAGELMRLRLPGTSATTSRRASASALSGATAPARCPTAAARLLRASVACAHTALRSAHLQMLAFSFASFHKEEAT